MTASACASGWAAPGLPDTRNCGRIDLGPGESEMRQMIISASRRTGIPAFYTEWLIKRLQDGYVYVRNPMNFRQVSRVSLAPEVVDCIVFWTKNPGPLLRRLEEIDALGCKYCFQYTLNPYGPEIEPHLPPLAERVAMFRGIAHRLGRKALVWRYDPILLTDTITKECHAEQFAMLAQQLAGCTERCVISFVDLYEKTQRNMKHIALRDAEEDIMQAIAGQFAAIGREYGIEVQSCSEAIDLSASGVKHGRCINGELIGKILGCSLQIGKDKNQRKECGCVESIDIGAYTTCRHGCVYCYANFSGKAVETNCRGHNPAGELLTGTVGENDEVHVRKVKSSKECRQRLL